MSDVTAGIDQMKIKELLEKVEAELRRRRDAYYDDPRHAGSDREKDPLITVLRETSAMIRVHFAHHLDK